MGIEGGRITGSWSVLHPSLKDLYRTLAQSDSVCLVLRMSHWRGVFWKVFGERVAWPHQHAPVAFHRVYWHLVRNLVFTHFAVFIKNGRGEFDFGYRWGPWG